MAHLARFQYLAPAKEETWNACMWGICPLGEWLNATTTLDREDMGKTFFLGQSAAITLTMPASTTMLAGCTAEFIATGTAGTVTIRDGGDRIWGSRRSGTQANTTAHRRNRSNPATAFLVRSRTTQTAGNQAGDRVRFVNDGALWMVDAFSFRNSGMSFMG